jgi:hypothetical protein
MRKKILIVTAAVVISGASAATAQQQQTTPQYQAGGFPISQHQMLVLQPSARITEQQRLSRQPTMDASRAATGRDFGIGGNTGY